MKFEKSKNSFVIWEKKERMWFFQLSPDFVEINRTRWHNFYCPVRWLLYPSNNYHWTWFADKKLLAIRVYIIRVPVSFDGVSFPRKMCVFSGRIHFSKQKITNNKRRTSRINFSSFSLNFFSVVNHESAEKFRDSTVYAWFKRNIFTVGQYLVGYSTGIDRLNFFFSLSLNRNRKWNETKATGAHREYVLQPHEH